MDIKMMHEMIEKLTECAKAEMDKKGIEELDAEEFGKATDIIKDLAEAMYYRTLTEAMKEAEYGEEYDEYGPMDDGRRGYRGQPRDSRGRYMSRRGRGGRRGYEEPPYWHMTPDMYHDWDNMTEAERMRDSDIPYKRMGYSNPSLMGGGSNSSEKSGSNYNNGTSSSSVGNSRYENARRGYEETKMMQDNSPEGKKKQMESLEKYLKELGEDMTELVGKMDASEKSMLKSKLQVLAQKVS